ncbi:MAG: hypothetical protein LBP90_01720, partial [Burkholderiales bacterium]|nr:hypothetical protein [Burkholderiales bacterium]
MAAYRKLFAPVVNVDGFERAVTPKLAVLRPTVEIVVLLVSAVWKVMAAHAAVLYHAPKSAKAPAKTRFFIVPAFLIF